MLHRLVPGAVVFVADVERVRDFYCGVAAMTARHQDGDHAVLDLDGFELVVHRLSGEPAVQPNALGLVPVREESYLKLCLPVASIASARRAAGALGGAIKAAEFEWHGRGFRACDGHDPEGNVFQVRESVAEPGQAPDTGRL